MPSNKNLKQLLNNALNLNERLMLHELIKYTDNNDTIVSSLQGEIVNGVTLVRDTDTIKIQLNKENESVVQSPDYGIELWETLDLSNLPTNFADSTELLVTFLVQADEKNVANWTTAFTDNPTMSTDTTMYSMVRFKLHEDTVNGTVVLTTKYSTSSVNAVELTIENYAYWNNTEPTTAIMRLTPIVFNGSAVQEGTGISISRNNISTYVESIKRKL